MSTTAFVYSNSVACVCGRDGPGVWVDMCETSETFKQCQVCRGVMAPNPVEMIRAESTELDKPKHEINTAVAWFAQVLELAELHKIDTQEDLELAGEMLAEVAVRVKSLTELKKALSKPDEERLAKTRAMFTGAQGQGELALSTWKTKISTGMAEMKRRTAEAMKTVQVATAAGNRGAVVTAHAMIKLPQKTETFQARMLWDYEVTDPAALPREFLRPDEAKIRAAMGTRLDGVPVPVPGVRFFQKESLAVSGTR